MPEPLQRAIGWLGFCNVVRMFTEVSGPHGGLRPWSLPEIHKQLALACLRRVRAHVPGDAYTLPPELAKLELDMLAMACGYVERRAELAPPTREGFREWFGDLVETGPGQADPLFAFLAEHASLDQMRWYLAQERASTHMPVLDALGDALLVSHAPIDPTWESLARANLTTGFALHDRYGDHAIGALAVVALTAPGHRRAVAAGLDRLCVITPQVAAFEASRHPSNEHLLDALVAREPLFTRAIAEGALARFFADKRAFDRYGIEFGLSTRADTTLVRAAS